LILKKTFLLTCDDFRNGDFSSEQVPQDISVIEKHNGSLTIFAIVTASECIFAFLIANYQCFKSFNERAEYTFCGVLQ